MNMNLVLATGLAYALIGAIIMFLSHRALYRKAAGIVAGYPKVLAALRAQRYDGRFGLTVLLCGNALQVVAACGYTVPIAHWRLPVYAVLAVIVCYCGWRILTARSVVARRAPAPKAARTEVRRVYETRRSMILLDAARREDIKRCAREAAKAPRDRGVVYVSQELECQWWSERFGVTPQVLRDAVRQVGPMVKDVERHFALKQRRAAYAVAA